MSLLLEARGLVKSLGGRRVVDGVDLVCRAGEVLGLLGPNGAGKTTTLRMLYGFLRPDAGTIRIEGSDDLARVKRDIGVCTQNDTFDGDFTVEQNLRIFATYFRPLPDDIETRVRQLLDRFGLTPYADTRPETLSGGFRRRLMMARALVHRPRLLFLDEPTTGLDPQARHLLWEKLRALLRQGKTILLTTHFMDEAERLCDRIKIIDHGATLAEGPPRALIAEHIEPEVVEVYGDGVQAWLDADGRRLADRAELHGETAFCYVRDPAPVIESLRAAAGGLRFLHRRANLEDVFLKLTGREMRE